jgi:hypothetical protein
MGSRQVLQAPTAQGKPSTLSNTNIILSIQGDDDTFRNFPEHLKAAVNNGLPDDRVESVVYPKYETKGELGASTTAFLQWQVADLFTDCLDGTDN